MKFTWKSGLILFGIIAFAFVAAGFGLQKMEERRIRMYQEAMIGEGEQ